MPIQSTYKIQGVGTVVAGRIETGTVKPGMQALISPGNNIIGEVRSIEAHN